jgi:hypothetical protein
MRDYWCQCGYGLLEKTPDGLLVVTDAFLRSLLERPELAPVSESCAGELALHQALLEQPRLQVTPQQLAAISDEDARVNYTVWLRFRERLLALPTLEGSYLQLFRGEGVDVPPLLVHQLTQILLRHVLGDEASPMQARAAEMLFRPQKVSVLEDGQVMAADDETVERHAVAGSFGTLGDLLKQGGAPLRTAELDVLNEDNGEAYWERDESHDLVISLNHGQPALAALAVVLQNARSTTTSGSGMSAWTPRPAASSTTCTRARRLRPSGWSGCCACSGWSSSSPRSCDRRSPAARCTWRWPWTVSAGCASSPRTCY